MAFPILTGWCAAAGRQRPSAVDEQPHRRWPRLTGAVRKCVFRDLECDSGDSGTDQAWRRNSGLKEIRVGGVTGTLLPALANVSFRQMLGTRDSMARCPGQRS